MLIDQNTIKQNEMDQIERYIDNYGVAQIILAVSHLASEKAEHIRDTWQDDELANSWDDFAQSITETKLFGL